MSQRLAETGPGYRELAPHLSLRPYVAALWVREGGSTDEYSVVSPDGCMDIVWLETLQVAGPATLPIRATGPSAGNFVGVRFHPGMATALLREPASRFRDLHIALEDVWPRDAKRIGEQADAFSHPDEKLTLLQKMLLEYVEGAQPDELVLNAIAIVRDQASLNVSGLADTLAVSERHLRRRFEAAVGYGPKMLQRILRAQRGVRLLQKAPAGSLTDVALMAGYADHAHMTHEVGRLTGLAPNALTPSR